MQATSAAHVSRPVALALGLAMVMAAFALCAPAVAEPTADSPHDQFPGEAADGRTLDTRRQVEELYANGAFSRALLIYQKELAPIGDKYAQYMVGYMHLAGQAVRKDRAAALAWYRLAAERGEAPLVKARDALERTLDPDERTRADEIFVELWQQYGDRKLLLEMIADDLRLLRAHGGGGGPEAGPSGSIAAGFFGSERGDAFYRRVRERLERRMEYLESTNRLEDVARLSDSRALQRLESDVRQELEALNLR